MKAIVTLTVNPAIDVAALLEKPLDIALLLNTISDLRAQGTLERLTRRNALGPGPRYGAPKPENAAEPAA